MRSSPTIAAKRSKRTNDDEDDERALLKQSSFQKNNAATRFSPSIKKRGSNISPRDVRQVDSSFSFAHLEDDENGNDDVDIEQTLLAISSFEVASEYDDAFKDEEDDTNSEYTGTHFVPGADGAQQSYAQFVPGVNASLSLDQSSSSARDRDTSIDAEVKNGDVETQAHEQLLPTASNEAVVDRVVPKEPSLKRIVVPTPIAIQEEDSFNDNEHDSVDESNKVTTTRRSRCCIVTALLLLAVALVMIAAFTVSRRRRNTNNNVDGKCSFCSDGTVPLNLDDKRIDESQTCSDLLESQVFLDAADSQCQQGQALGWMFCDCPTVPSVGWAHTSCSYCPDGVEPTGTLGEDCADFNTAVRLAGSSPFLSCEEAIAMVPDYCGCPNLDPVEQFSRLVRPISGEALEDSTSPQFRALAWIANLDPAKLSVGEDSAEVIQQRYVAAVLYYALGGTQWTDTFNFLSADKACLWNVDKLGIHCDEWDEITSIRLPNNNLAGNIPREISFFSRLNTLDLQSNAIAGTLPESITTTDTLEEIDLSDNSLIGSLPSALFRLSLLRAVDLSRNMITGELPASIGDSTQLESLLLRGNDLHGTIAPAIAQNSVLQSLDLDSNNLTQALPEFGPSCQMRQLFVGNNLLTGAIPESLGVCLQLQVFSAVNNDLVGTLPDLSQNERLIVLELSQNRLSGNLERLFTNTPPRGITHIQIQGNLLSGSLPTSIGLFSNLVELRLGENRITGVIPTETGGLASLMTVLSLSNNRLTGTIPSQLGSLTNLQGSLDLASNKLEAMIPTELGRLGFLQEVDLAENLLTGTIPIQLDSLRNLRRLRLSKNYLRGDVSLLLSNLSQTLETLYLNGNLLSGTIPPFVGEFTALQRFEFFSNSLVGTLPWELEGLTALQSLQLTENSLNGTIPISIGNCAALEFLSLGHNELTGAIPTELAKLTALERLFVVGNSLTGSLDFLCTREAEFDYMVANWCGANVSISCDCCTHCCDPTSSNCNGM